MSETVVLDETRALLERTPRVLRELLADLRKVGWVNRTRPAAGRHVTS